MMMVDVTRNVPHTPKEQLALSAELRNVINERNILTTRTRLKVLSALDNITQVSAEERRNSLRLKAMEEVLTSEVSYLRSLEIIMTFFMEPLKKADFVDGPTLSTLFGHVETLYRVNGELLRELKEGDVAAAFLRLAPYFKLYSVYAYDYKQVLATLQELEKKNPKLHDFVKKQESRPEVSTKLPSLLITPVQRVPRYRLLLREILTYTPQTHPDFSILSESLQEVEKVARHINDLVQSQENMERMVQLQNSLRGSRPHVVTPGRRLIKEGFLMKVSKRGEKAHPRYFVLFNDILMYCKVKKENVNERDSLLCRCVIPLKKCVVCAVLSRGVFKVTCLDEELLLYTATAEEGERWVAALTDTVKQYHECRQTLRKDSSSRRPVRKQEILTAVYGQTLTWTRKATKRKLRHKDFDETQTDDECVEPPTSQRLVSPSDGVAQPRKLKKLLQHPSSVQKGEMEVKDSLYPLRDSMQRRTKLQVVTVGGEPHARSWPDEGGVEGFGGWPIRGLRAVRGWVTGLSQCIRRHVLRRPPVVPPFHRAR